MNNNDKLTKVVLDLFVNCDTDNHIVNRQKLRQSILRALDCEDRGTVYSMIERLLSLGFIRNNPTSQLSAQKYKIMPTNDTRYFIENEKCYEFLKKTIPHAHTTLDAFTRSSSETQEENKGTSQL